MFTRNVVFRALVENTTLPSEPIRVSLSFAELKLPMRIPAVDDEAGTKETSAVKKKPGAKKTNAIKKTPAAKKMNAGKKTVVGKETHDDERPMEGTTDGDTRGGTAYDELIPRDDHDEWEMWMNPNVSC